MTLTGGRTTCEQQKQRKIDNSRRCHARRVNYELRGDRTGTKRTFSTPHPQPQFFVRVRPVRGAASWRGARLVTSMLYEAEYVDISEPPRRQPLAPRAASEGRSVGSVAGALGTRAAAPASPAAHEAPSTPALGAASALCFVPAPAGGLTRSVSRREPPPRAARWGAWPARSARARPPRPRLPPARHPARRLSAQPLRYASFQRLRAVSPDQRWCQPMPPEADGQLRHHDLLRSI